MDNPTLPVPPVSQNTQQLTPSQTTNQLLAYSRDCVVTWILYSIFFAGLLVISVLFFPEIIAPPVYRLAAILSGPIIIAVGSLAVKYELITGFTSKGSTKMALWSSGKYSLLAYLLLLKLKHGSVSAGLAEITKVYLSGKKARAIGVMAVILGCLITLWGISKYISPVT